MQERRKSPRVKERLIVVCQLPEGATAETLGESHDMNATGIRVSVPQQAIQKTHLTFDIHLLSDAIPVPVQGKIVWVIANSEGKMQVAGIEFQGLDDVTKQRISGYIQSKIAKAQKRSQD